MRLINTSRHGRAVDTAVFKTAKIYPCDRGFIAICSYSLNSETLTCRMKRNI